MQVEVYAFQPRCRVDANSLKLGPGLYYGQEPRVLAISRRDLKIIRNFCDLKSY